MSNMIWTGAIAGTLALSAAAVAFGYSSVMETGTPAQKAKATLSSEARLMQFDGDRDGKLTRGEMDMALSAEFRAVDTNNDGRLDAAEIQRHVDTRRAERTARYEAWRAKAEAQGLDPRNPPFDRGDYDNIDTLRYADWNMDGAVTPEEFGGRARAQFMRADRNGDGLLTADELKKRTVNRGKQVPA